MKIHCKLSKSSNALVFAVLYLLYISCSPPASAQQAESTQDQINHLASAIAATQAQMEATQRQLEELKRQLATLQAQMAVQAHPTSPARESTMPSQEELAEKQAVEASQIATLDQAKVGSESRFPVRISGLILLNGFVNTGGVDLPATPTAALGGRGNTGLSVRQTVLGVDARGPHLAGASSRADLRVDFFASPVASTVAGYASSGGILRLRTGHAVLDWKNAEIFLSMDRPIFTPWSPNSLTAIAQPPLLWSGNLATWLPQTGGSYTIGTGTRFRMQAAALDAPDAPASPSAATGNPASQAELSRWPGVEARLSLLGSQEGKGPELGVGGYFGAHRTPGGRRYDAWATTLDARMPLPGRMQFTANAYRGASLGGMGGGGYKDYILRATSQGNVAQALDDIGGWAQLTEQISERLQANAAFGMDEVFASELRSYTESGGTASIPSYGDLARNRTFFANGIYSPSAYLTFSFEYRRISTAPVTGRSWDANVYGFAGGYRF